jgi:hypothetical protein
MQAAPDSMAEQVTRHIDSPPASMLDSEDAADRPSFELEEQEGVKGLLKLLSSSGLGLEKVDGRLKSFTLRWRLSNSEVVSFSVKKEGAPTPEVLSKVGFYFCPDTTHKDR